MSQRQLQIESLLQRAVATVLQRGLADPRVRGLISVTAVDVSPDLRHATVQVSIVPAEQASLTMHGLHDATRHIQNQVNKLVALRSVPHLLFKLDGALKKQADVLAAIHEAMQRTESATGKQVDPQDASPDSGASDADSSSTSDPGEK